MYKCKWQFNFNALWPVTLFICCALCPSRGFALQNIRIRMMTDDITFLMKSRTQISRRASYRTIETTIIEQYAINAIGGDTALSPCDQKGKPVAFSFGRQERFKMAASDATGDDSLYPIAVLIDELRNEDVQVCRMYQTLRLQFIRA